MLIRETMVSEPTQPSFSLSSSSALFFLYSTDHDLKHCIYLLLIMSPSH